MLPKEIPVLGVEPVSRFDQQWERIERRSHLNRRRGERVPVKLPVLVVSEDHSRALHCMGIDVSLSGAQLYLSGRPLPGGDVVRVCMALPSGLLRVWARPARQTPGGRAIE